MQFILTITANDGTTTSEHFTAQDLEQPEFWPSLMKITAHLPGGHVKLEVC